MKYYSTKIIKEFLEKNHGVESITLGMAKDWSWTASTFDINADGSVDGLDLSNDKISVAGISGSAWATPTMRYTLMDGTTGSIDCYEYDGNTEDPLKVSKMKMIAALTGGMDYMPR